MDREKAYSMADAICCTSRSQARSIGSMVASAIPVAFVPNGVDPEVRAASDVHPFMEEVRKQYRWIGLYAGKHSKYTDLGNLVDAARHLEGHGFALVLLGGGYTRKSLQERVEREGIRNVFFHEPVPKSEVASFESGADLFFINYSPEKAWAKVLPNKVFDYMYWNKPIVAAVVPGEITKILAESGSGASVRPGSPLDLADAVKVFLDENRKPVSSREFLMARFDRRNTVRQFVKTVENAEKRR